MKTLLGVLALSLTMSLAEEERNQGFYAWKPEMLVDPARKLGTTNVTLFPLFAFARREANREFPDSFDRSPMPRWKPLHLSVGTVSQNGLYCRAFRYGRELNEIYEPGTVFITNYPYSSKLSEGSVIHIIACEINPVIRTNLAGAKHQLRAYDYGVPSNAK